MDRVFHALSDPIRRAILANLGHQEKTVNELAKRFTVSLPAISKHLKVLEGAGLIVRRRAGRHWFNRVDPRALRTAQEWLEFHEELWNDNLESLRGYFENGVESQPQ